jgi:hypothetical protein
MSKKVIRTIIFICFFGLANFPCFYFCVLFVQKKEATFWKIPAQDEAFWLALSMDGHDFGGSLHKLQLKN